MAQMQRLLSGDCVLMIQDAELLREELAARDELLMDRHLEETAQRADYLAGARRAMRAGMLYPVLSGSALMDVGVDALMQAIAALAEADDPSRLDAPFSAKVYRVTHRDGMRYC